MRWHHRMPIRRHVPGHDNGGEDEPHPDKGIGIERHLEIGTSLAVAETDADDANHNADRDRGCREVGEERGTQAMHREPRQDVVRPGKQPEGQPPVKKGARHHRDQAPVGEERHAGDDLGKDELQCCDQAKHDRDE